MKHIKEGVQAARLKPIVLDGLLQLAVLYQQYGLSLVVTALSDGQHKVGSLHYKGYAADLRSRDVPPFQLPHLIYDIQHTLGHDWDVIQEADHIHIEYDPAHDGGKALPE